MSRQHTLQAKPQVCQGMDAFSTSSSSLRSTSFRHPGPAHAMQPKTGGLTLRPIAARGVHSWNSGPRIQLSSPELRRVPCQGFTEALVVGDTFRIAIINNNRPASYNSVPSRPLHSSTTTFSLVNISPFLVSLHQLPRMLFSQIWNHSVTLSANAFCTAQ